MIPQLVSRIHRSLDQGFAVPLLNLHLRVNIARRVAVDSAPHQVTSHTIDRLVSLFPALARFVHPAVKNDASSSNALLDFLHEYLPLIYEPAREAQVRRLLARLRDRVSNDDFKRQLTLEIARSDARSGVCDRATALLNEPATTEEDKALVAKLRRDIDLFENRYAAAAGLIPSRDVWAATPGDVRGQSLLAYFNAHRKVLAGKRILHVAPESSLREWFQAEKEALGIEYVTLDPFSSSVDLREDLTDLKSGDASFNMVICHRVLEHILDDRAALSEIHRVLAPGGILSFSVPQSTNLDSTNEWMVPDLSHDLHVRQYGNDLDDKLRQAGFASVVVDRFLLDRRKEQHVAERTYPLRMFICTKA
jgi:SAM-dependent methyltransferase